MYIDIHNHCLPLIDDGAESLEEALKMLRISKENGVRQIIATPHYHYKRGHAPAGTVREKTDLLNVHARQEQLNISIYSGNEIYYCHDIVELLNQKQVLTLADSRYVLIEFSPSAEYEKIRNGLYDVVADGYSPILAHAERVQALVDNVYRLNELIDMGVYIQINITSIKTRGSRSVRKFVKTAIKNDMVHFFATDAHHAVGRNPATETDRGYLQKKYGEELVNRTMYENPMKVIKNETI